MQSHEIYHPVAAFLLDFHSGWHVRYEYDLVQYATVVENKYGVEVLRGCGPYQIMNVFSLNNGRLLDSVCVATGMAYCNLDDKAAKLIDWIELDKVDKTTD